MDVHALADVRAQCHLAHRLEEGSTRPRSCGLFSDTAFATARASFGPKLSEPHFCYVSFGVIFTVREAGLTMPASWASCTEHAA